MIKWRGNNEKTPSQRWNHEKMQNVNKQCNIWIILSNIQPKTSYLDLNVRHSENYILLPARLFGSNLKTIQTSEIETALNRKVFVHDISQT